MWVHYFVENLTVNNICPKPFSPYLHLQEIHNLLELQYEISGLLLGLGYRASILTSRKFYAEQLLSETFPAIPSSLGDTQSSQVSM